VIKVLGLQSNTLQLSYYLDTPKKFPYPTTIVDRISTAIPAAIKVCALLLEPFHS